MQCRGNSKRHTMANPEDVHNLQSAGPSGGRTRRTGLLTVMERPPGKSPTTEPPVKCSRFILLYFLTHRVCSNHAASFYLFFDVCARSSVIVFFCMMRFCQSYHQSW